jgi:NTE family protein
MTILVENRRVSGQVKSAGEQVDQPTRRFAVADAIDQILASAAIPAAFPSVRIDGQYLIDGAIGSNTAILTAAKLGATRIIVLPTGFPPRK